MMIRTLFFVLLFSLVAAADEVKKDGEFDGLKVAEVYSSVIYCTISAPNEPAPVAQLFFQIPAIAELVKYIKDKKSNVAFKSLNWNAQWLSNVNEVPVLLGTRNVQVSFDAKTLLHQVEATFTIQPFEKTVLKMNFQEITISKPS